MSHESLGNPFRESPDAPANLTALAEQGFLSPCDIAKLKELERQKDPSSQFQVPGSMEGISLEEGMSAEERKSLEKLETRKNIIAWAEKHDLGDEDWVDETFEFQPDGTVICPGDLGLAKLTEPDLPSRITEVRGYLDLSNLTSAEGLNLPDTINGNLHLSGLTSAEGLILTDIKGDVYLDNLPASEKQQLREKYPNLSIL